MLVFEEKITLVPSWSGQIKSKGRRFCPSRGGRTLKNRTALELAVLDPQKENKSSWTRSRNSGGSDQIKNGVRRRQEHKNVQWTRRGQLENPEKIKLRYRKIQKIERDEDGPEQKTTRSKKEDERSLGQKKKWF